MFQDDMDKVQIQLITIPFMCNDMGGTTAGKSILNIENNLPLALSRTVCAREINCKKEQ